MSPTTQKTMYPRSRKRSQSANSRQKAKRPSLGKRKTSSSSSYSKSEQPFSVKYISTSNKISSQRLLPWPLVRERSVGLWDSMSIYCQRSVVASGGHLPGGHFLVAGWPYCEWKRITSVEGRGTYCRSCTRTPSASASLRAVRGDAIWRSASKFEIESAETPLLTESCWRVIRRSSRTLLRLCSNGMGHAYPFWARPERPTSVTDEGGG